MAFCPNCGHTISESARFCRSCGASIPAAVPPGHTDPPHRDPVGRGLRAAICIVATLCVITSVLWAMWPQIRPEDSQQSANNLIAIASNSAPRATPASVQSITPSPMPESTPIPTPEPTPIPAATEEPHSTVTALTAGSHWRGHIDLNNYAGEDALSLYSLPVTGYIGVDDGKPFFEIYDGERGESDTSTILSMYVDLYDDHLVPVIGADDAWVFEITLDQTAVGPLTIYLRDGYLTFDYAYRSDTESCDLHVVLYPDP